MCADTSPHAGQHCGNRAAPVEADEAERILAV
jgi:hypothetical protein